MREPLGAKTKLIAQHAMIRHLPSSQTGRGLPVQTGEQAQPQLSSRARAGLAVWIPVSSQQICHELVSPKPRQRSSIIQLLGRRSGGYPESGRVSPPTRTPAAFSSSRREEEARPSETMNTASAASSQFKHTPDHRRTVAPPCNVAPFDRHHRPDEWQRSSALAGAIHPG